MKNKVSEKHPPCAKDFVKVIKEVWVKEFSQEFCRNLVHSMPRRLQDVIKNGGGSTKYHLLAQNTVNLVDTALKGQLNCELCVKINNY